MKEYIDRHAAIESSLAFLVEYIGGAFDEGLQEKLKTKIKTIPAVDVVPVVRCRDCKFRENDDFCTGRGFPYQLVPDDGFCDKGERKE